jgi:hypothetical protein
MDLVNPPANRPVLRLLALVVVFCAGMGNPRFVSAQTAPTLSSPASRSIQRGQSTEVTLNGQHLAAVASVTIRHARGLEVAIVPPAQGAQPNDGQLHVKLSAAPDAILGEREVRLMSPAGVSAPLHISVGQYPEIPEKEPNNTPETAQEVSLPATLVGKIEGGGDVDCFRFTGAKGQQFVFDVHAARSGSSLDAVLSILNANGRELATKIEFHAGDPTLLFEVPADGQYVFSIRDLQYRGGGDFGYRIDAGVIPYLQALLPMTAEPGKTAEVRAVGVNLPDSAKIPLDLTYAGTGDISVRASAPGGLSNAMKLEIGELPAYVEKGSNRSAETADVVPFPVDISARLDKAGDEGFFKFHIAQKQAVTLEVIARRMGSPVDALLSLRNVQGNAIETNDGAGGPDARITRELDTGDYVASIRDLFFHGGAGYGYRLQIRGGATAAVQQDFSVRFLPDAARVSRGGNTVLFCDVQRKGEFKGDVTITLEDLPPGVNCPPLVVNEKLPGASGMLVVSAAPDAPGGSFPIKLRATATVGSQLVTHLGDAMLGTRPVEQAWLSILESAPFTVEAIVSPSPQRLTQLVAEADGLASKIASPSAQLEVAQAQWEKRVAGPLQWDTLEDVTITSAAGTKFTQQSDGSVLAGVDPSPDKDTYTIVAPTDIAGITGIRLEVIPDPTLPAKGPGRAGSGNFVLSHLTLSAAPQTDPGQAKPVMLHHPRAGFEQEGYPALDAIEPKPGKGWAMFPHSGNPNEAVFFTSEPVGTHAGTVLTFTLDQQFGMQHTLGRFRITVTADPEAQAKAALPAEIAAIVNAPADKRSPEQKAQLTAFYRTQDPGYAADVAKLETIRNGIALHAEIARLEAALTTQTPEIDAQREEWQKQALAGAAWLPLDLGELKSQNGASLQKEPDDSVFVGGANPSTDVYTIVGNTTAKGITALRIEALPDPRLPGNGPGRAPNGNFVLTKLVLFASPKDKPEMAPPIEFKSARGSFEQQGFPAADALGGRNDHGWAIMPNFGKPSVATYYAKAPFGPEGGSTLTLTLENLFAPSAQHTLGHFRVWVTSNPEPDATATLPADVLVALKAPNRNEKQRNLLTAYYRGIAPSLEPARLRLAELKAQAGENLTVRRDQEFSLPFLLTRPTFAGNVQVSLDGFIAGREPGTGAPTPISGSLKFTPATVGGVNASGVLKIKVDGNSGMGTRYCTLKAEAKVGNDTITQYSAPFVLTVADRQ